MIDTTLEVAGIKDALREINSIDKKLRRQITSDFKKIMEPTVNEARTLVPKEPPLSGFARSWTPHGSSESVLPFSGRASRAPKVPPNFAQSQHGRRQMGKWLQWQKGVNAYVSGKRPVSHGGYTRSLAAFGVKWQGPAAVLFDTAHHSKTPQGAQMIHALRAKYGSPSRVMWRAYTATSLDIQDELRQLVNKIMRSANRKLR